MLVAHRMTNVEIAEHLGKLGLRGRTDAVVTVYRSGMVHPAAPLPSRSC